MTTLSNERPKGNSKTAKQKTPNPTETPPEASQGPGALILAADTDPRQRPLYMSSTDEPVPVTYDQLVTVIWEALQGLEGCMTLVEDLEKRSDGPYEMGGSFVMLRATMNHLHDRLFSVQPNEGGVEVPA